MATKESILPGTDSLGDSVTIGRLLVPVAIVVFWQLITVLFPNLIISPGATVEVIQNGFERTWWPDLQTTMRALLVGFVIAAVGGGVIGLVLGLNDFLYDVFEIYVLSIYSVPKVVLFPIFLFLFQIGFMSKMTFAMFHGLFPMILVTMAAVREIDDIYLDLGRSLRLSRWQTFRHIAFPFILVQLTVALRLAFSLTFLGVILAELFASKSGLGLRLQHAMAQFDMGTIFGVVTVLMIIAFVVNIVFYAGQRYLEKRWNVSAGDGGV
ncbi:ABC transporter permease subunit [Halobellus sp. GM3]|uniref:ABC transporter permease subunit n=1 Tax=Halobellus sp. GM3 TaxID=3458410 RepID=UPI00403DE607